LSEQEEDTVMIIFSPVAPAPASKPIQLPPDVKSLSGVKVGILTNRWKSMDHIARYIAKVLPAEHGAASVRIEAVPINGGAPDKILDSVAADVDFAIVGLANCGSCTAWSVHDQIALIKRGIPSYVVVTDRFVGLAKASRRSNGVPDAPMIVLPITEDVEYSGEAAMQHAAELTLDGLVKAVAAAAQSKERADDVAA
jgi:hypothetical protein